MKYFGDYLLLVAATSCALFAIPLYLLLSDYSLIWVIGTMLWPGVPLSNAALDIVNGFNGRRREQQCPKCGQSNSKIIHQREVARNTTTTETRRIDFFNKNDKPTGYSEETFEVPDTYYETIWTRQCLSCNHNWAKKDVSRGDGHDAASGTTFLIAVTFIYSQCSSPSKPNTTGSRVATSSLPTQTPVPRPFIRPSSVVVATPAPPQSTRLAGEKFPETRLRLLSGVDVDALSSEAIRYAINEIYARHGADFKNEDLRRTFSNFRWYQPVRGRTYDETEKLFTPLEAENLKLLGKARDARKNGFGPSKTAPLPAAVR